MVKRVSEVEVRKRIERIVSIENRVPSAREVKRILDSEDMRVSLKTITRKLKIIKIKRRVPHRRK